MGAAQACASDIRLLDLYHKLSPSASQNQQGSIDLISTRKI